MSINIRVMFIAFVMVFSACSSTPQPSESAALVQPEWITHPQVLYPDARYLSVVGVGKNRSEAIQDARKNLAESFLVKVKSETLSQSESEHRKFKPPILSENPIRSF